MKQTLMEDVSITLNVISPFGIIKNSARVYSFFLNSDVKQHYLKTLASAVVCLYAFEVRRVMELNTVEDIYSVVEICKENISEAIESNLKSSPQKQQDDFQARK